jgi:hypothetical protein
VNRPTIRTVGRVLPAGTAYIGHDGAERVASQPFTQGWEFGLIRADHPGVPGIDGHALEAWSVDELARLAYEMGTYQPGDYLPPAG